MPSYRIKVEKLSGLKDDDLTEWEANFVRSLAERVESNPTYAVSEKQALVIDRIYNKHFAD